MSSRSRLAIILATDPGARMTSDRVKALHEVGSLSLVGHALANVATAKFEQVAAIVGAEMEAVRREVARRLPDATCYERTETQGDAAALAAAAGASGDTPGQVIVLSADRPLVTAETLARASSGLESGADLVRLGASCASADAPDATAIVAVKGERLDAILTQLGSGTATPEAIATAAQALGLEVLRVEADAGELRRVATLSDLAAVEAVFQARRRAAAMEEGATLIAPETVFFSYDTRLGRDVVIEPNVVFGPGVTVADGARIRAFSHLETASVGPDATVGPYARLRPGAEIGAAAHIGNFVEIKNATVEAGAKVNHLSYIGDARVGEKANIGAGTITCNYDGFLKHHTDIGAGAFVGSNSTLVAPLAIGDGAYLAAGGVVTADVPDDGLAIGRARQVVKEGRGAQLRARFARAKAEKTKG